MTKLEELKEFFTRRGYVYTWHPSGDEDDRNCQDEVCALLAEAEKQYTLYCRARDLYHQAENAGEIAEKRCAELETKVARVSAVFGVLFDRQVLGEALTAEQAIAAFQEAMI